MATLTALKFQTVDGAEKALEILIGLQKQQLIQLHDAAVVSWPEGKQKPKTRQAVPTTAIGSLNGAFWGMLFGLLFFMPFLGAAIGAATGAISGALTDFGIDDSFINDVRAKVTPGSSALFTLTSDVVADRVLPELKALGPEVIATNLAAEQEAQLRAAFGEE